ncbi:hypothetical protein AEST_22310 [Alishewanella aestuarii B11]|uniref:Uncharacterized protein n=1 Tax=Alishewanella aestuarii B11 TaxID=1197174 RepID=J2IEJ5_9ALTE|nr:hypothetical protein AEST_22310 [Alishewanella aestuarii B11]
MAVLTVVLIATLGKELFEQGCYYFDRILLSNEACQKMHYHFLSVALTPRLHVLIFQ